MVDYQEELKRLQEQEASIGGDFWKPNAGQHKVKALGELEDAPPYEEEGKEPQQRRQINLLVDGKEVVWTMPFGRTPASTYGQLVNLATANNDSLKDKEFTVVVVGEGQNKRFTIVI
jgi:hypothetical protein